MSCSLKKEEENQVISLEAPRVDSSLLERNEVFTQLPLPLNLLGFSLQHRENVDELSKIFSLRSVLALIDSDYFVKSSQGCSNYDQELSVH